MPETEGEGSWSGPLDPSDVVIRGGQMRVDTLVTAAEAYYRAKGVFGISLWSLPGCDAATIARRARLRHPVIRQSVAGQLIDLGWDLQRTRGEGHVTMSKPTRPTDADWRDAVKVFLEPQPNPGQPTTREGR